MTDTQMDDWWNVEITPSHQIPFDPNAPLEAVTVTPPQSIPYRPQYSTPSPAPAAPTAPSIPPAVLLFAVGGFLLLALGAMGGNRQ